MKIVRNFIGLLAGFAVLATMGASASAAGSATMLVNPASGSYTTGSTFTVTISEDSGANDVDSARAQLSYNAGTLEIVGYSTAGNPFTTCTSPASYGGGSINTGDCTLLGGKKQGNQPLGAATFKVLANSGSSSLTFSSSSQVVSNGVDSALSFVNGAYSYSAPAPAPAPVSGGMGGGSSAPVTSNSSSNNANTNSTVASNSTTPAASDTTPAANGEVKADATKKSTAKTSDNTKKNVAVKKSSRTVWPWIILIVLGAVAVAYGMRNRKAVVTDSKAVVSDAKPKTDKTVKTVVGKAVKTAAVVPVAAKKAATPVKKTTAKQPATQTRKKSGEKAGKKSR
ncbi:MAG TPA: hypothetical protein VGO07_04730 [Candidatus Saccharimonadales bacterium]|jgi:hypothetical protein|nr:hypothetical protein [Candidatus Saccharimonadales bacterium]